MTSGPGIDPGDTMHLDAVTADARRVRVKLDAQRLQALPDSGTRVADLRGVAYSETSLR